MAGDNRDHKSQAQLYCGSKIEARIKDTRRYKTSEIFYPCSISFELGIMGSDDEVREEEPASSDQARSEDMVVPMPPPTLEDIKRDFDPNEEEKAEVESPSEALEVTLNEDMGVPMPPPTLEDIQRDFDPNEEEKVEIESPFEAPEETTLNYDQNNECEGNGDGVDEKSVKSMEISSNERIDKLPEPPNQTETINVTKFWIRMGVALIIVMSLVVLGMLVATVRKINKDSSRDLPVNNPTTSTNSPNAVPTISNIMERPTPSPSPAIYPTTLDECRPAFRSISGESGATLLTGLEMCGLGVSLCEARQNLPFEFQLRGNSYKSIFVTADAMIRFYEYDYFDEVCASECGGIAVARTFSPYEIYQGQVWTLASDNSFVVSWENISFDGLCCDLLINAQLTIYRNGNVEICWGEGKSEYIYASIWDDTQSLRFPTIGDPFSDFSGEAKEWPTNQCRFFVDSSWKVPDCETFPYSCEQPQHIEIPFEIDDGTLDNGVLSLAGESNPAMACPVFYPDEKVVWYDFRGTGSCVCIELRSSDTPFMIGIYQNSTGCDSLDCIGTTDFTSESMVLRAVKDQTYKIAVSQYPSPEGGQFQLRLVEANVQCPTGDNSFFLLGDSCP